MLSQTRYVLKQARITGPFVLLPHSMSGIEALYWAQTYPNEVENIISLDMSTPLIYECVSIPSVMVKGAKILSLIWIARYFPQVVDTDAVAHSILSDEEK